ncbi:MAG: class I SAM-dependent methyltransferase [Oscillospiraceae bacterium]|nr:class I SAM-dependent methyltransferase [Oscillospiraceae bacterium]
MWISDNWKEYELFDCGGGERLECWNGVWLVRPDPQAIWERSAPDHPRWASPDGRYLRSKSGGGEWQRFSMPERWTLSYGSLRFHIRPMNFKHTGLFPEQAVNWDWAGEQIRSAGRPVRVLNLFAYTGGATISAAAHGAGVCHVDAARGMVALGRENAALSGLADRPIRWIVDDCMKFIEREARRGSRYDAIIMDPPSYGRGPSGEVWHIEDALEGLVMSACALLSDDPLFVLVNSYSTGLSPWSAGYILQSCAERRYGGVTECGELGIPVTASGLCLPAGNAARWSRR